VAHALLILCMYDFTISFVQKHRTIRIQRGIETGEHEVMDMNIIYTATRIMMSLLALLTPVVLFGPHAYAETYVAGQFGVTMPSVGKGLSDGDLTTTSFPDPTGTSNVPNMTVSDQSLKTSFMLGGKIGHYFSRVRWFGLEAEIFYSTPHIKQQDIRFTTEAPGTFTPSGGGPIIPIPSGTQFPLLDVPGANFHVLTIAPLNLMFRYPGYRLQPYIGVGPGIFIARIHDSSVTQGDNSQSSTKLGLNTFIGARYYLTKHVSAFAEAKYNYVRFNFEENTNSVGFNATYSPLSVAFGIGYHF
jgi:opacity protein-like surface antigen